MTSQGDDHNSGKDAQDVAEEEVERHDDEVVDVFVILPQPTMELIEQALIFQFAGFHLLCAGVVAVKCHDGKRHVVVPLLVLKQHILLPPLQIPWQYDELQHPGREHLGAGHGREGDQGEGREKSDSASLHFVDLVLK